MTSNGSKVRIGIVTADPLRALGLQSIVEDDPALEARICNLEEARRDASLSALLLDDRFSDQEATAVLGTLRRERPALKLIVLGEAPDLHYIQTLVGAGARGYLLETTSEAELRMALEAVLDGSVWAPRKVLARLIDSGGVSAPGSTPASLVSMMTARELQVLELLVHGCSNREIGRQLAIDEVTVKAHLGRMLRKTQSKNRVELTLRVLEERGRTMR